MDRMEYIMSSNNSDDRRHATPRIPVQTKINIQPCFPLFSVVLIRALHRLSAAPYFVTTLLCWADYE
jgi:hypothetical protein